MSFTGSDKSHTEFTVVGRVGRTERKPDIWGPAIDYAHSTAWYITQCLILEANGVNTDIEASNHTAQLERLWKTSGGELEARNCDLNGIDLLDGYDGEIPSGKEGKPAVRFNAIGLFTGGQKGDSGSYRKEFVCYLKSNRIPSDLVLLVFPARRGVKDGRFNLKLTYEK